VGACQAYVLANPDASGDALWIRPKRWLPKFSMCIWALATRPRTPRFWGRRHYRVDAVCVHAGAARTPAIPAVLARYAVGGEMRAESLRSGTERDNDKPRRRGLQRVESLQSPAERHNDKPKRLETKRTFRWLTIKPKDREDPELVRELVKCGKPSCRCSRGVRHGPYWYFRYEEWDSATGVVHYRREYVPPGEVRRVRRCIQRARRDSAQLRSILSFLRRSLR
jgi:Family of unknown function (DUF6788)